MNFLFSIQKIAKSPVFIESIKYEMKIGTIIFANTYLIRFINFHTY